MSGSGLWRRRDKRAKTRKPPSRSGRRQAAARVNPGTPRFTFASWALVGVFALALAGLRIHIFRLQYTLGEAVTVEKNLMAEERAARVRLAGLRDPKRLARIADRRGFAAPEHILRISSPSASSRTDRH